MVRFFYNIVIFIFLSLTISCTKNSGKSVVHVQLPDIYQAKVGSLMAGVIPTTEESSEESPWVGSIVSATDVNCYLLMVGSEQQNQNVCKEIGSQNDALRFGPFVGGVPSGGNIEIELLPGAGKTITLVGMYSETGSCKDFKGQGPDFGKISHPRILSQVTMDLEGGEVIVEMEIPMNLENQTELDECIVTDIGNPQLPTPVTSPFVVDSSEASMSDQVGYTTASSIDTFVVGSPNDDTAGMDAGAIYAYKWIDNSWFKQKLVANDGASMDGFGKAIATENNTIIVGAKGHNSGQGAVYIFHWNGSSWVQLHKLEASDGSSFDYFGSSVDIHLNRIVVGASQMSGTGKSYIFQFNVPSNSWNEELIINGENSGDSFGSAISIHKNNLVIGAPFHNTSNGKIYIYEYNPLSLSWTNTHSVLGESGNQIGKSIDIYKDTIVYGIPTKNTGDGEALIIEKDLLGNWQTAIPIGSGPSLSSDNFGAAVAIHKDKILIGAPNGGGDNNGEVFIYQNNGAAWSILNSLTPLTAYSPMSANFGTSVSLSPTMIGVGTPSANMVGEATLFPTQ